MFRCCVTFNDGVITHFLVMQQNKQEYLFSFAKFNDALRDSFSQYKENKTNPNQRTPGYDEEMERQDLVFRLNSTLKLQERNFLYYQSNS